MQIGETNSAIELLKQQGAEPRRAAEKWTKLYPKNCIDQNSLLCQVSVFEQEYYKGKIRTLEEGSSALNMPTENIEVISNFLGLRPMSSNGHPMTDVMMMNH